MSSSPFSCELQEIQCAPSLERSELVNIGFTAGRSGAQKLMTWAKHLARLLCLEPRFDIDALVDIKPSLETILTQGPDAKLALQNFRHNLPCRFTAGPPIRVPTNSVSIVIEAWRDILLPTGSRNTTPPAREVMRNQARGAFEAGGLLQPPLMERIDVARYLLASSPIYFDFGYVSAVNSELKLFHALSLRSLHSSMHVRDLALNAILLRQRLPLHNLSLDLHAIIEPGVRQHESDEVRTSWNLLENHEVNARISHVDTMQMLIEDIKNDLVANGFITAFKN